MTIRNDEAKEGLVEKPEGEGETEPSADEDVEVLGGIGEMDQSMEYIVLLQKQSNCIKRKTGTVLGAGVLNTLYRTV